MDQIPSGLRIISRSAPGYLMLCSIFHEACIIIWCNEVASGLRRWIDVEGSLILYDSKQVFTKGSFIWTYLDIQRLGAVQVSCNWSRGEGVSQMLTFVHSKWSLDHDHALGGREEEPKWSLDHSPDFGLEQQKRANLYTLCLILDSNMFLHNN